MSYKEYTVRIFDNGDKEWLLNGEYHREDGAAIEYDSGNKEWYLNDKPYTEAEFKAEMLKRSAPTPTCDGEVVEIYGKKYKITAI